MLASFVYDLGITGWVGDIDLSGDGKLVFIGVQPYHITI